MSTTTRPISKEESQTIVSSPKLMILRISRSNPQAGTTKSFMEFKIPYEKWTTVLDAILEVKKHFDHSVAVRYSCRQASCGSCGMVINGKPRLACFTKIAELNSSVITVEPMNNFPIIRDLAVNFDRMFSTHKKLKPYIIRDDSEITSKTKEFLNTRGSRKIHPVFKLHKMWSLQFGLPYDGYRFLLYWSTGTCTGISLYRRFKR